MRCYYMIMILVLAVPWPCSAQTRTAHVSWNYPPEREDEINGFELYLDNELVRISPPSVRSEDLAVSADPDSDRCFAFKLRAFNDQKVSEFSEEVFACLHPSPADAPNMEVDLDQISNRLLVDLDNIPSWAHVQVFLDADGNPGTGYVSPGQGIQGADYLIEDTMLYTMNGIRSDRFADWQAVGTVVSLDSAGDTISVSVGLEYLTGLSPLVHVAAILTDGSWTAVANVPDSFMSVFDLQESQGEIAPYTLPSDEWRMLSLPADPQGENTVQAVFGDDIKGQYLVDWIVYQFDADNNQYIQLGLSAPIAPGNGYWIYQATGNTVQLDMPQGSAPLPPDYQVRLYMPDQGMAMQWNLAGYPLHSRRSLAGLGIITASGDCGGSGCTLEQASSGNIFYHQVWRFDGTQYESLSDHDLLGSWDAFWCAVLDGAGDDGTVALTQRSGLSSRSKQYLPFEEVTLELEGQEGGSDDWIGVYPLATGSTAENNAAWTMTGGKTSGEISVVGLPSGEYEARLFTQGTAQPVAVSAFSVHR